MIDELLKKKVIKAIDSLDKTMGQVNFFALSWRENVDKWDVLVNADWVDSGEDKAAFAAIFDAMKGQFNGEFPYRFAGLYPLKSNLPIVRDIVDRFEVEPHEAISFDHVTFGTTTLDRIVIFVARKGK